MWAAEHAMTLGEDGILAIDIRGFWNREQVDRFFHDLVPLHRQARQRHGRVLALVHVNAVQSPAVALHVRDHAVAIKQREDRTAMVLLTMLSKLQIQRIGGTDRFAAFTDAASARAWLRDEATSPPARA